MNEAFLGLAWKQMALKEGHRQKLPASLSEEEKRIMFGDYIAPRTREFMRCVDKHPRSTSNFIGKQLKLSRHVVNATLNRLAKNKLINRVKNDDDLWVYYVTDDQRKRAGI